MSWLTQTVRTVADTVVFAIIGTLLNIALSFLLVLFTYVFISDMDLVLPVPFISAELGVSGITLAAMNVFLLVVGMGAFLAYKLITLFDNIDFSFDTL